MSPSITITLRFDAELQRITGAAEFPVVLSIAATFAFLLMNVMEAYPQIGRAYPPGVLEFTLNGKAPEAHSPLFHGDVVYFTV